MIDFNCPKCGEMMSVPDSLRGKTEDCPACREPVKVPEDSNKPTQLAGFDYLTGRPPRRGFCKYCGKKVSLFRQYHKECHQRYDQARQQMVTLASNAVMAGGDLQALASVLSTLARSNYVPTHRIREALVAGWGRALDKFLDDSVLSEDEEERLMSFAEHLGLANEELDAQGAYTRAAMGGCLRDVLNGKPPNRFDIKGQLPFNLQKSESLIWMFKDVPYYEERTKRSYVGGYQGVSIRVMKGLYYRTGGFRGHPE